MQINRLRLLGFKSFVEPTELVIEKGLTGVVGPNGCGKSNLLEALRWVMGETSHKSMRAAAMDDVIFAGTTIRPARNLAEVTIFIDNSARTAPSEWNGADVIEITRRIEREAGSAYRINGQDVRARDVKILFEDAATGARSPALVRQGQISEIVNAKPEQRRRILEDAAGVAGLHSRRHDAELRLRAAEANLARLADVMGSLTTQLESLKRQARQARRYKELSVEIRKAEAVAGHVRWTAAQAEVDGEEAALREVLVRLGIAVEAESKATRAEAELAESIQPLRDDEAVRGAVLARLKIEQDNFEKEAERLKERRRELEARAAQLEADVAREMAHVAEAAEMLADLDEQLLVLTEADEGSIAAAEAAEARLAVAKAGEGEAAARLSEITRREAEQNAHRRSLEASLTERREQAARIVRQLTALDAQIGELSSRAPDADTLTQMQATAEELAITIEDGETRAIAAEERAVTLGAEARAKREAAGQANLELRGVETEHAMLARMLRSRSGSGFTPVLDLLTVAPGYEAALGAALGDDLDAPVCESGSEAQSELPAMHWRPVAPAPDDVPLPEDVERLGGRVQGPDALRRRLDQIGVVARADGPSLQTSLKPGQRLVSKEGDLWRWDGFTATADAPTASAERLAQRNRLAQVELRLDGLRQSAEQAAAAERAVQAELSRAETESRSARQSVRDAQAKLARARDELARLERAAREAEARLTAVGEAKAQADEARAELHERVAEIEIALEAVAETASLEDEIVTAEQALALARAEVMRLAGEAAAIGREQKLRAERLASVKADRHRWASRSDGSSRQIATLEARANEAKSELAGMADLPAEIEAQRQRLMSQLAEAEASRTAAADKLVATETALRAAQQSLRAAHAAVATEREGRARSEARLEAARNRRADESKTIREALGCEPDGCLALAEFPADAVPPSLDEIERQLARLKGDRERLGGVNLAADQELEEINAQFEAMEKERLDVEEAINKLRGAIGQLNREGKKRIDEAFQAVNSHFQSLFTTLFGGGEARLEMLEGEDPLEGGLEIIAKPPGKKPATLSLLSGGEQTLTALSLIFAVFLTNPSPICVLDEVDAPLDDSNVDRFSTLMEKMSEETATRFLVITHHPMTMARMHRLFGVTMGEKGVSQLVSVDLATAERIIEDEPQRAAV